ncbi:MAG: hypothetical protein D3916_18910, partial [Candidatus Electrothrix sp. MAN1_4]|nr:hypothetical protein [Candidatus Electrothrix sp. MAN1_4]
MAQSNKKAKSIHISEYLPMLLKHKLLIAVCFLLGTAASLLIVKQTPPGYEATAKLTIKAASAKGGQEAVESAFFQELNLNTHLQLILSAPVLEKLIEKLQLNQRKQEPEFLAQIIGQVKENFFLLIGKEQKPRTPEERQNQFIQSLKARIAVQNIRYTNIMEITSQAAEPETARDIANTLAKTYIQYDIDINQQATANSFQFLQGQVDEFKEKLDKAEAEFLAYKQQENLFSLTGIQESLAAKMTEYDLLL